MYFVLYYFFHFLKDCLFIIFKQKRLLVHHRTVKYFSMYVSLINTNYMNVYVNSTSRGRIISRTSNLLLNQCHRLIQIAHLPRENIRNEQEFSSLSVSPFSRLCVIFPHGLIEHSHTSQLNLIFQQLK